MEDSVLVITAIDTIHRVIADSVTVEALTKSQEFYSAAFDKILAVLGIFLMLVLAPSIWSFFKSRKYRKELKEAKKRILDLENEFREKLNKFNEELEKQKKIIEYIKNELQYVRDHEIFKN
jgi:uncharacterized membrane protein YqjE